MDTSYSIEWLDPTTGQWFVFDTTEDEAEIQVFLDQIKYNARPFPWPQRRVVTTTPTIQVVDQDR